MTVIGLQMEIDSNLSGERASGRVKEESHESVVNKQMSNGAEKLG